MTMYSLLFAVVGLLALTSIGFEEPKVISNAKAIIIAAVFWILSFARWENGTDWVPYNFVYESLALHGTLHDALTGYMGMEPGYLLANLALGWAHSYHFFLLMIGLSVIGLKILRIVDLSPCATYSCLIYLAAMLGDIFFVRQAIAISICFFSLKYLLKQQRKAFALCVLFAATFHYSALIFLLALAFAKDKRRSLRTDATVFTCCIVVSIVLFDRLLQSTGSLLLPIQYLTDRLAYITDNQTVSALSSTSRNVIRMLEKILVYFFFVSRYPYVDATYRRTYSILLNLYYVSVVIICCFSLNVVQILRFAFYFSIPEIILFPIAILSFSGLRRQIVAGAGVGYAFLRFWMLLQPYYDLYVPFNFFGQKLS
jgi:hypothetical protein